ncbi:MAG: glycosyltransferase [Desulfobacteraceae bacterium]|nr:MAG: glycosyltransferase [Desulfobacteraceae bacterium]
MITVFHLITELNTGGAEQMLYKVITGMDRNRFRSIVVSMTDKGTVGGKIAKAGFPVLELGMTLGTPNPGGAWRLYRHLRRERPDILQTWLYHADLLGILVGKMAAVRRIVWSVRCSDMDLGNYRLLTTVTLKICARLSACADAILVNSEQGKRVHEAMGYEPERMVFIPNGFDTELFHADPDAKTRLLSDLRLGRETFLIGQVARFDLMKDHANFLRGASLFKSRRNVHFVLAGKGMVQSNAELVKHLDPDLHDRVHLLGPREDIPSLTPAFDIATSSSAYGEGFSNSIGEAMSCGVPCVVTDVGDSASIVGDTGMVVPPRDPEALAGAWLSMLELGDEKRRELGERARKRVVDNYGIEKVVGQFEEFYEKVIQGPGSKVQRKEVYDADATSL